MNTHSGTKDEGLLASVDFRAFFETLKLRWWVTPVIVAVSLALVWTQASEIRTTPGTYTISRTFEARDSSAVLAGVGLDPTSVRPFPDLNNQLTVLQSEKTRNEIVEETGLDVNVSIQRSRPSFTLIETLETDGQSSFVFQSGGAPTYVFSCSEPQKADCDKAIDAYADKASSMRKMALQRGLSELRDVLSAIAERGETTTLSTQIIAIEELLGKTEAQFVAISSSEQAIGPTIDGVRRPTYLFGILGGLIISLIVTLQLTFSDNRVRTVRQFTNLVGEKCSLGNVTPTPKPAAERRAAAIISRALSHAPTRTIRYVPIGGELVAHPALERVANLTMASYRITRPFSELSVLEMSSSADGNVDVLVAVRNKEVRADIVDALSSLEASGRQIVGVILVD